MIASLNYSYRMTPEERDETCRFYAEKAEKKRLAAEAKKHAAMQEQ